MKKSIFSILVAASIATTAITVQSCRSNDDEEITVNTGNTMDPNNFQGEIKKGEILTLDPSKVYKMTGPVFVNDGATLVIPAGTRIEASGGTSSYLTVKQGGKIFANGTASQPVVFTSLSASPGSWGGLVICGKAPINKGSSATAEVGNATYGGSEANDNSGVLNYVKIEYAGAIFTADKEFNGLSLFAVGNGTSINHVALLNGSDDGIEFFGGTVNVSNIISIGNEDDAFDWTEGWNGTATNIFTKRRADGNGNRGIEGDNNSNNNNADPRSNPTIKNATFIGATTGEADGLKLRVGTHGNFDNIVLSGWKTGINLEHDATLNHFNGNGKITNVKFDNITTEISAKNSSGNTITTNNNTYTINNNASGAGNGTTTPTWALGWSGQ